MLQSFFDVIEGQKYYHSDPIYKTFDQGHLNHSFCVAGWTRDGFFLGLGSYLSSVSQIPLSLYLAPGLRSHVKWVSRVLGLGSQLQSPGSWVPGPTYELGPGSWVLGPTLFWKWAP